MANLKISDLPSSVAIDSDDLFLVEEDGVYRKATPSQLGTALQIPELRNRSIRFEIDGGGTVITTGAKLAYMTVPYDCTITGWRLLCNPSASVTLDVWEDTYANRPPTNADSMIATGTKPSTTSATGNEDLTVDWADTTLTQGNILEIEVESNNLATWIALEIFVTVA